ncbi:MAG: phosphate acyltransferase PlsX [Clostridiales bacterium]|jgi:glycerol-3-phosphate acyltransferase PlsX|nr:phosphate acyltransferase PlsX [Clostridiales bacterium]
MSTNTKTIVVDLYGADDAPGVMLDGARDALKKDKTVHVTLVGDADTINGYFAAQKGADMSRVAVVHAPGQVTNEDVPTQVVRTKPDSSLVTCLNLLRSDENAAALVSCGSTGAVLMGGTLVVGRLPGVKRPALAPVMPTVDRKQVILVDCGANVDCRPAFLLQFAVLGVSYMKAMCGIENPRVGLLSNGTEDKKGNEQTHAAFALLKGSGLNFVGNMEARDLNSGRYDVVVADGFAGNIALKSLEGAIGMYTRVLKEEINAAGIAKLGALLLKKTFARLKSRMDYTEMGGAAFLGCNKVIIKSHGSSKASTICASILKAKAMVDAGATEKMQQELALYGNQAD